MTAMKSGGVSWLQLERYALGELSAEEARAVEAALKTDAKARARMAEIRGAPVATSATPRRWLAPALAAGVALSLTVLLSRTLVTPPSGAKGDTLTLSVVRQHEGTVVADPLRLVIGDKYKLQVTCVPPREARLGVEVAQDGAVGDPFGGDQRLQCANDAPLPEALTFDSSTPAEVCVIDRDLDRRSCVTLR